MFFGLDTAVLDAAQALCIALPAAGVPALLLRLGGRGWALVADIGDSSTDYGDFFVAGLVGGILAAEHRPQAVPPALVLMGAELWRGARPRRDPRRVPRPL